jgi:site-specific DNA recombinase
MKRKLVINASEAKIVRHIFREYLKGKGIVTLTLALNSHDLRIRGGRPFSKNTVANILHNEKYAGDMAFGKRRNREGRQYPVKFDTVIVRNCHEPIIDRKDFDKVQALLASRHPDVSIFFKAIICV